MSFVSIGDLAQSYLLGRHNSQLKTDLTTLGSELATGVVSNPSQKLSGDFGPYAEIERGLNTLTSYQLAITEATMIADSMQAGMSTISDAAQNLSSALLLASSSPQESLLQPAGVDARGKLEQAVATLNTDVAGKSLFSGAATDSAALVSADALMADLTAAVAGQTTVSGLLSAIDTWFDSAGGGFETNAYIGADTPAGPIPLADGQGLTLDTTAEDPAIRTVLKGLATAVLLEDKSILGGDTQARADLAGAAAETLLYSVGELAVVSGRIGGAQNRIADQQTENAAQIALLEQTRANLIGADPYETATKLEATQDKLEMLYSITARLSRLSLADYLG